RTPLSTNHPARFHAAPAGAKSARISAGSARRLLTSTRSFKRWTVVPSSSQSEPPGASSPPPVLPPMLPAGPGLSMWVPKLPPTSRCLTSASLAKRASFCPVYFPGEMTPECHSARGLRVPSLPCIEYNNVHRCPNPFGAIIPPSGRDAPEVSHGLRSTDGAQGSSKEAAGLCGDWGCRRCRLFRFPYDLPSSSGPLIREGQHRDIKPAASRRG